MVVMDLPEQFRTLAAYLPFIGTIAENPTGGKGMPPALIARLIELALFGGIMFGVYTKDMEAVKDGIRANREEFRAEMQKVNYQIEKIRTDFYLPRGH